MRRLVLTYLITLSILCSDLFAQEPIGGPYKTDSATVVLMHFNQNFNNDHADQYQLAAPNTFGNISFLEMKGAGDLNDQVRFDNDSPEDKSHIQIPDTTALDLNGSWTIEYWLNTFTFGIVPSSTDWRYHQTPLIKPGDKRSSYDQDYARANYYMRTPIGNRKFIAGYYSNTSEQWIDITSPTMLHIGEWYHVTFIRDTSKQILIQMLHQNAEDPGRLPNKQNDSLEIIYFDAVKYGTSNDRKKPRTNEQPLFIGATPEGDTLYGNLDGFMDELRISK